MFQSVMTGHMDMTVSTTAVVTVLTHLHVTNILDTVTKDVIQDIKTKTATKVYSYSCFLLTVKK